MCFGAAERQGGARNGPVNWWPRGPVRELDLSPQLECVGHFYLSPWGRGVGDHRSVPPRAGCSLLVPRPGVRAPQACARDKGAKVRRSRRGGRCLRGRQDSVCRPKEGFTFYYPSLDKSDLGHSKHAGRKNKGN